MKQAAALEKAGKYEVAAEAYGKAAQAFEAAGKPQEQAAALGKSATMYEKLADQLLAGVTLAPNPAPVAAPPPADDAPPAANPAPANPAPIGEGAAPLPLETSAIVSKNAKGALAVAAKNGKPLEGIKLSRHDTDIYSPSIAVAPNGTIHVAFVEQKAQTPFTVSVYHCFSSDGGKTWSEAKNLSEALPEYHVGNCKVAVDGQNRAYVLWHTGIAEGYPSDMEPHSGMSNNIVYRVFNGGAWSKPVFVPPAHGKEDEGNADGSWFVSTDPTGQVHVVWNMLPYSRHPEAFVHYDDRKAISPAIGASMVMEADLNGTDAGTAREIYLAKIANDPEYTNPGSDHFDMINGYVDAAGQPHFVVQVTYAGVGGDKGLDRFDVVEAGKQTTVAKLPGRVFEYWHSAPQLLLDAKGREHVIAWYNGGEQPNIRDYVVGSDDEPTVIRAAKAVKGKVIGFQAYQGAEGRMIVLMEMNDTGEDTDDELYLSTSDGTQWSAPVNVTNNSGHSTFFTKQTSALGASHVSSYSYWYPTLAAATYDRQGHLVLVHISNKLSMMESNAFGWTLAGGSTKTPQLLFLKF